MNAKEFESLVNKGAITHVGIAADVEKMSDKELCDKYITKHEVAAEVLAAEPATVAEVAPEVPTEEPVAEHVAPKKASKKSTKKVDEPATPAEPEVPAE